MRLVTAGVSMLCAGFFLLGMSLALFSGSASAVGTAAPIAGAWLCLVGYLFTRPALQASKAARNASKAAPVPAA